MRRAATPLSLGTYPDTTLSLARQKAAEARRLIAEDIDPSDVRKQQRQTLDKQRTVEKLLSAGLPLPESFEAVAREWYGKHEGAWATGHKEKIIRRLERDVFPWLGAGCVVMDHLACCNASSCRVLPAYSPKRFR